MICDIMKNKGFTLIEMLAVMAILAILMGVAVYALQGHLIKGRNKSFKIVVNTFEDGVLEAYTTCLAEPDSSDFCTNHPLPDFNGTDTITLKELEDEQFIEPIKNPWKKDERCNPSSTVTVTRNDQNNISFDYKTCLICGEHSSEGCN